MLRQCNACIYSKSRKWLLKYANLMATQVASRVQRHVRMQEVCANNVRRASLDQEGQKIV